MVSDGATGPVPGESHNLFWLVLQNRKAVSQKSLANNSQVGPILYPRSSKESIEKVDSWLESL